jgi:hypothetical protein
MTDDLIGTSNSKAEERKDNPGSQPSSKNPIEGSPKADPRALPSARPGSVGKIADRPHRWTIVLSLLAAAISITSASFSWLSLNETRENRRINEQTARAYLKPTSLVLDASLLSRDNWANRSLKGSLTITNGGRVAARNITAMLDTNPPRNETLFDIASFSELPPGSTNTVRIIMKMTNSQHMTYISDTKEFAFGLQIRYLDGVNLETRTDESTFCMSMEKPKLKGMISLYPCDVHFSETDSHLSQGPDAWPT